jgi:hypothetical protein
VAAAEYSINEAMAALSVSKLGQYNSTVACTNSGVDGTDVSGVKTLGASFIVAGNDVIRCKITNTPLAPTVRVVQLILSPFPVNLLPPFRFDYLGNNGWTAQQLQTNTLNVPVSSPTATLLGATDTFVGTTLPDTRWFISSFKCNDTRSAATGNPSGTLGTNSGARVTIPAANVIAGAAFQCVLAMGHKVP